jgi:hypothetical protein
MGSIAYGMCRGLIAIIGAARLLAARDDGQS